MTLIFTHRAVAFWFFKGIVGAKESESEVVQSCPTLCDLWTVVGQAPPSMGFSRLEYWSGLSCPPPGDLPDPGMEPRSPTLQADSTIWATRESQSIVDLPIDKWSWKANVNFRTLRFQSALCQNTHGKTWAVPPPEPSHLPLGGLWSMNLRTA